MRPGAELLDASRRSGMGPLTASAGLATLAVIFMFAAPLSRVRDDRGLTERAGDAPLRRRRSRHFGGAGARRSCSPLGG